MSNLLNYRAEIDVLDDQIIDLLVQRIGVCHKVAVWKMANGVAARLQDRIDAVREITKLDPAARILMCSAMGQQALVVEAIQAGAKDFVVKPFQPSRVLEAVNRVLAA